MPVGEEIKVTVSQALDDLRYLERYRTLMRVDSIQLSPVALAKLESMASSYVRALRSGPDEFHGSRGFSYDRQWDRTVITSSGRTIHRSDVIKRFRATPEGAEEFISRLPRLRSDGLATTLRAGTGRDHGSFTSARPIHHFYPRVITVREAARLHSFPDWFRFHTTKWHAFQQIGNSVPPFLAESVAQSIIRALGHLPRKIDVPSVTTVKIYSISHLKLPPNTTTSIPRCYQRRTASGRKGSNRGLLRASFAISCISKLTNCRACLMGNGTVAYDFCDGLRGLLRIFVCPDTYRKPTVS